MSDEPHPRWMAREEIAATLRQHGHQRVEVGLEDPDHPHGPPPGLVSFRQG